MNHIFQFLTQFFLMALVIPIDEIADIWTSTRFPWLQDSKVAMIHHERKQLQLDAAAMERAEEARKKLTPQEEQDYELTFQARTHENSMRPFAESEAAAFIRKNLWFVPSDANINIIGAHLEATGKHAPFCEADIQEAADYLRARGRLQTR